MYCPHNILVNNSVLYVLLHTTGDHNWKRQIPLTNWFNPKRYRVVFFPHTKYRFEIGRR